VSFADPGRAGLADWAVYVPLAILLAMHAHTHVEGDTTALIAGARNAVQCLATHTLPCDRYVPHLPIFQYLLAAPLLAAGLAADAVGQCLSMVNTVAGVLAGVLFFRFGRGVAGLQGAHLAAALVVSGYAAYYLFTTFNEMTAFTLYAAFTAAVCLRRRFALVMVLAVLCGLTKEIMAPFIALAYIAARVAGRPRDSRMPLVRDLLAGVAPVIAGIAVATLVNFAFNAFRYGTIVNVEILQARWRAPAGAVATYFADLFLAPAGGLVFVWLSLAACAVATLVAARRRDSDLAVLGLACLIVVGANAGLAMWWSPFGWYAWGPRLTLPFLGGAAILLVSRCGPLVAALGAARPKVLPIALVAGVLFASMLPTALMLATPGTFFSRMFAPTTMDALTGGIASNLDKGNAQLYMLASMESYGRNVVIPATLAALPLHPLTAALAALFALLASWRICFAPRGSPLISSWRAPAQRDDAGAA
jgi:hypothetical protein